MAKREVASQYIGSLLGFIWTFVNPIVLVAVLWVVFSIGFRVKPLNDVPFIVWLTAGISAWSAFAEMVNGSSHVIVSNGHIIKKTLFQSQILPVVKIISSLITHSIFLILLIILILFHDLPLNIFYIQFIYYMFCLCVLALGIGWLVSALNVFLRDVAQITSIIIQIGFWATPIFWDINMMPENIRIFFKLNPMYYVIQGYRESFIYFNPFWNHPLQTLYFWIVTSIIFISGALVFKKLKPHFADVL